MAKLIMGFEEFGGITEFNGGTLHANEPLIINKAADYLCDNMWAEIDDEDYINYRLTSVNWSNRTVDFHIEIKGV